uniref:integrase core domain-containing protein n=1 Tax=Chryseobacterium rhizoplanae TaxID=1609531 RepID=UPI00142EAB4A
MFSHIYIPTQNSLIERFNKSFREGILDAYLFSNLEEVRKVTEELVEGYNYIVRTMHWVPYYSS